VTRARLQYEKSRLDERIHLLEGLAAVVDVIEKGDCHCPQKQRRADAAKSLCKRFQLTEAQALFIVDLRIYQLSRTSIEEITAELEEKRRRVAEIERILRSEKALKGEVAADLQRIAGRYRRRSRSKVNQ